MLEITVPETKPATEWVNGRALQKMSPQERHARVQALLAGALSNWAMQSGAGRVGTEWEFRVTPPHEPTRPLVPDVAFLSFARLGPDEDEAAQIPHMAPDAAFEILSPGDRRADVDHKIAVYLAAGARLVVVLDPVAMTFECDDEAGRHTLRAGETFTHAAMAGLAIPVSDVFRKFKAKGER